MFYTWSVKILICCIYSWRFTKIRQHTNRLQNVRAVTDLRDSPLLQHIRLRRRHTVHLRFAAQLPDQDGVAECKKLFVLLNKRRNFSFFFLFYFLNFLKHFITFLFCFNVFNIVSLFVLLHYIILRINLNLEGFFCCSPTLNVHWVIVS